MGNKLIDLRTERRSKRIELRDDGKKFCVDYYFEKRGERYKEDKRDIILKV